MIGARCSCFPRPQRAAPSGGAGCGRCHSGGWASGVSLFCPVSTARRTKATRAHILSCALRASWSLYQVIFGSSVVTILVPEGAAELPLFGRCLRCSFILFLTRQRRE